MKKIIAMLVAVATASTVAATAFAAVEKGQPTWTVSVVDDVTEVNPGDEVKLELTSLAKGVQADVIRINYDTSAFEAIDVQDPDGISYTDEENSSFSTASKVYYSVSIVPANSCVSASYNVTNGVDKTMKDTEPFATVIFKAKDVTADVDAVFEVVEQSDGTASGYIGTVAEKTITVKAPKQDSKVAIDGAWKTTNATWNEANAGKNTMYWKVSIAEGYFTDVVATVADSADTEKSVNVKSNIAVTGAVDFGFYLTADASYADEAFKLTVEAGGETASSAAQAWSSLSAQ